MSMRICCELINLIAVAAIGIWGLTVLYGDAYQKEIERDPKFYEDFDNFFKWFNWIVVGILICFGSIILCICGWVCLVIAGQGSEALNNMRE